MTDNNEATNGLIRVEDYLGRLLFMYNPSTRNIEYIPMRAGKHQNGRRQKFIISTDALRSAGMRNLITDDPKHVFVVQEFEEA